MNLPRASVLSTLVLAFAGAAFAAPLPNRLVIPASARSEGVGGARWTTDLDLLNAGPSILAGRVSFIADGTTGSDASPTVEVAIPAKGTLQIRDAVGTLFGLDGAAGALSFDFADSDLPKLAIGSRTYNDSDAGTFGQTIPALESSSGIAAGKTVVLFAPREPEALRLNFGAFAFEDSVANWRLVDAEGHLVAERLGVSYPRSTSAKYNDGIRSFFGSTPEAGETLQIEIVSGRLLPWASRVDNRTNDGDFSLPRAVRPNEPPLLRGLDTNSDGVADIPDSNGDGTLDLPVAIAASSPFPYEMRLIGTDPEGRSLTWTGIDLPSGTTIESATGKLVVWPGQPLYTAGRIRVRLSDGTDSIVATIPVSTY
jgi:hypothetical protein